MSSESGDPLPEVMPARRRDALSADFDAELVVFVPGQRRAHHFDEGLSLVFDTCDGVTPTADVVAEVVAGTGRPRDEVARWLAGSLAALRDVGVLEG